MSVAQRERVDGWTFDHLADLHDEAHRHEVVDGLLLVSPRPTVRHDRIARALAQQLDRQAPQGWQGWREVGLRLGSDGRVADAGLVRERACWTDEDHVGFDPRDVALAVEVVSPSSRKTDRLFKPAEYAAAGIGAYWRVETEPEVVVHVRALVDGTYRLVQEVRGVEHVDVPFAALLDVAALTARGGRET